MYLTDKTETNLANSLIIWEQLFNVFLINYIYNFIW